MINISSDQIPKLIETGCLKIAGVTPFRYITRLSPSGFQDNTWKTLTQTRVEASICGHAIVEGFDPNRVGSDNNFIEKLSAKKAGMPAPEPRPSEKDLTYEVLAKAVTENFPQFSNHEKLRICTVLEINDQ